MLPFTFITFFLRERYSYKRVHSPSKVFTFPDLMYLYLLEMPYRTGSVHKKSTVYLR